MESIFNAANRMDAIFRPKIRLYRHISSLICLNFKQIGFIANVFSSSIFITSPQH